MTPRFRAATLAEVAFVLDWAREEGWNPGIDDAPAFYASDPSGFFVAETDGIPAAAISVVNHGPDFSFLGLYICRPRYRGSGIGYALWSHALAHAGKRTVGLDGVPDQQANYRKSGFVLTGQTFRFSGTPKGAKTDGIRPVRDADRSVLTALEARANGYVKPAFMAAWLSGSATRKTLVLDRGEGPAGFATLRHCAAGTKIGPLVAKSFKDAETLFLAAAHEAGPGQVILDVPDDTADLMSLCEGLGMSVTFNTARMYRGPAPAPDRSLVRSIATLELG